MRQYHRLPNRFYKPSVNLDKLWSLVTEQHRLTYKDKTDVAPVIDVVRAVSLMIIFFFENMKLECIDDVFHFNIL